MYSGKTQKCITATILACFVFVFVVSAVFAPRSAQAQPTVVTGGPVTVIETVAPIRLSWSNAITASATVGLINAIQLFAQTFAYDLAVGLANGFKGQNPFAFLEDPGTYFTSVAFNAAGEFIGSLRGPWEELGLNLCSPRIPDIGLAIGLGLAERFQRPTPKCDFANTINNWRSVAREASDPHALLKHLNLAFDPGQTDIGQALKAQEEFRFEILRQEEAAKAKRDEGKGILPQEGIISGRVKTPASVIDANFRKLPEQGAGSTVGVGDVAGAALQGNVWAAVGTTVLSTFVNTLLARSLRLAIEGIFADSASDPLPDLLSLVGGTLPPAGGERRPPGLSPLASTLLATPPRPATGAFEYLSEFAAECPKNNPAAGSQFCGTIDAQFMVAIQQASTGKPMTVREAVEKGYLNRSRAFGFTNPVSSGPTQPEREPTLSEGYAYSSLKKLRLFRIIPLGWELAAERINADDQTATLGDVLDGWDREGDRPGCQGTDEQIQSGGESRFCGLLDPNWVLKAPLAQCGAQVFSSILDASGLARQENCADVRHCIADDGSGSCDGWGYCTREKNEWRFDGDACSEQYVSCDTFKADVRGAQAISLLENTLDFGACTAENAGCTGYFSEQAFAADRSLSWNTSSARLYLDRDAPVCSAAEQGCSEIILATPEINAILADGAGEGDGRQPDQYPASVERVNYRLPPEYLGCTGEEGDPAQCGNFSRICRAEEAGCESYTPAGGLRGAGEPAISAIATALDNCPSECVGYDTYVKLGSRFEPAFTRAYLNDFLDASTLAEVMPVSAPEENFYPLIPTNALSCNAQEVGCEEFTNLRTEAREYYSDVRACQQPAVDSQTYFTWEGSDTSGYQLRTWSFKRSGAEPVTDYNNDGNNADSDEISVAASAKPPCTNYSVTTRADGNIQVNCTDTATNQAVCDPAGATLTESERADCRAFYDESGNIFHRYLSRTIVSTDECQAMRWTGLPVLPEILPQDGDTIDRLRQRLEQAACEASHGFWNTTTSECLYLAAPSLSNACRAAAYGCRAFKGNTAGNIETVFSEDFEGSVILADRGWSNQFTGRTGATLSTTISISAEAINVGGHSLRVAGAISENHGVKRIFTESLTPGATYFARLNIKGTAGAGVRVALGDENLGEIELTPEWRYHELGPLVLSSNSAMELRVRRRAGDTFNRADVFYLDDVSLRRTQDTLYLIKYGWNVPNSCDRLPEEAGGGYARGAMLGCRSYTDRAGAGYTFKSFASLCRDAAVGCTEIVDTRNSEALFEEAFNETNGGICRGVPGPCRVDTNGDGVVISSGAQADEVVCTVAPSQTTCQYTTNLTIDDWEVASDTRKFIVRDEAFSCPAAQQGCSALGRSTAGGIDTVYLRNDPERYASDLCQQEALGCQSWTRSDRSAAYFKDPGANGCSFKTNVQIGSGQYSGWFRDEKQPVSGSSQAGSALALKDLTENRCKGWGSWNFSTGQCIDSDGNTVASCGGIGCTASLCARGASGSWVEDATAALGGRCVSDAPCYGTVEAYDAQPGNGIRPAVQVRVTDAYLAGGASFGIWRNADAKYGGLAGACPAAEATCTAFYDPTDTSRAGVAAAYHFKDNARLQLARSDCDGKVSRSEGCVLFRNVEDPTLRWSAQQSYLASDNAGNAAVLPVPLPRQNDTNTILKVTRDRVCAEWFQCASAQWSWDAQLGRMVSSCRQLGRCNELADGPAVGNTIGTCRGWVREPLLSRRPQTDKVACEQAGFRWDAENTRCQFCAPGGPCTGQQDNCEDLGGIWHASAGGRPARCTLGRVLTPTYLLRDRTFGGVDYVGYTVPNVYAVDELEEVDVGSGEACGNNDDCASVEECKDGRCGAPRLGHIIPGETCTPGSGSSGCSGDPWCTTGGQCVLPPTGGAFGQTITDNMDCRGYPEQDAPFANTQDIRDSNAFAKVSKCMAGDSSNCVCDYTKAEFGGNKLYFAPNSPNVEPAYCFGVPRSSTDWRPKECTNSSNAATGNNISPATCQANGGVCQKLTANNQVRGWRGYCLERDPSRNINADQNQNPCLTWFPVDQLDSILDIRNLVPEAAYTVASRSGTRGQYYCLLGGDVENNILTSPEEFNLVAALDNVWEIRTYPRSDEGVYRYDIKEVIITITNTSQNGGPTDGTYVFSPGQHSIDRPIEREDVEIIEGTLEGYHAYDFRIPGSDISPEWWWWGGDDGNNRYSDNVISQYLMSVGPMSVGDGNPGFLSMEVAQRLEIDDWTSSCDFGRDRDDEGYDATFVGLHFNPESQQLDYLRLGVCTNNETDQPATFTVSVVLHPHCEVIAGIDTEAGAPRSAPNTQLLWEGCTGSECIIETGTDRNYTYNLAPRPFGSANTSSANTSSNPEDATHPWFLNHNRLDDPNSEDAIVSAPFAGWPYACQDLEIVEEHCFTRHGFDTGRSCEGSIRIPAGILGPGQNRTQWERDCRAASDPSTQLTCEVSGNLCNCERPGEADCQLQEGEEGVCRRPDRNSCTVNVQTDTITQNAEVPLQRRWFDLNAAVAQFKNIFAKSMKVFRLSGNDYQDRSEVDQWDSRVDDVSLHGVPEFQSAHDNGTAGSGPIAVNNVAGPEAVQGVNGALTANLSFYMWAPDQHMPIRRLKLDFGDGRIVTSNGLFKNSKPSCGGFGFGGSAEACETDPHRFEHIYFCGGPDDPYWRAGSSCPIPDFEEIYGGCCVFKPRVQATDNWGFCNGFGGACQSNPAGSFCFEEECNSTAVNPDNPAPWAYFEGEIIIAP